MCSEQAEWCFSPVTPAGISHFLLAIPVPLTGTSVPERFECGEVEDTTETTSFFLLFSLLNLFSIDLESFQRTEAALVLSVVDELTNADCQNPL